jgi:hypothetical protein
VKVGDFHGVLSLDTLPPKDWAPTRLAKMSVGKPTIFERPPHSEAKASTSS